jgi:hypothetical protein
LLEKIPPKLKKKKRKKTINKRHKDWQKDFFLFDTKCQPTLYEYVLIKQHKLKIKKCPFHEIFMGHGHNVFQIINSVGGPNRTVCQ